MVLKTLNDIEVDDGVDGKFVERWELKQEAIKWIKEIKSFTHYVFTGEDAEMLQLSEGIKCSKGYLKTKQKREDFAKKTGVYIDEEYDNCSPIVLLMEFFNISKEDLE